MAGGFALCGERKKPRIPSMLSRRVQRVVTWMEFLLKLSSILKRMSVFAALSCSFAASVSSLDSWNEGSQPKGNAGTATTADTADNAMIKGYESVSIVFGHVLPPVKVHFEIIRELQKSFVVYIARHPREVLGFEEPWSVGSQLSSKRRLSWVRPSPF